MSREYRLAYAKGYAAGSRARWPAHRPPAPPHAAVGPVVAAAQALRDEIGGLLQGLEADDLWERRLAPRIDALDAAMAAVSAWLTAPTPDPLPKEPS